MRLRLIAADNMTATEALLRAQEASMRLRLIAADNKKVLGMELTWAWGLQ